MAVPTAEDFQNELNRILAKAWERGDASVDVRSGDLHGAVGGYPGPDHRMPVCCSVMIRSMKNGDEILRKPAKGMGASLIIRYFRKTD